MKSSIKLIILDVDGVVKGFIEGVNSPYPSERVINYLRKKQDEGIPICLCTGKVSFAMKKIVAKMDLNNLHVTDGGAVIFDPIDGQVLKQHTLLSEPIQKIIEDTHSQKLLWELYTLDKKYVETGYPISLQESRETMPWDEVDDLRLLANQTLFTKAEVKYLPEHESYLKQILAPHQDKIDVQWTLVPVLLPLKIAILTAKGVSKRSAVAELMSHYHVDPPEVLAVGDTIMDWGFMEGCGYVATMGNADDKMKQLICDHHGFVGGHVDDDGLIDILEHYQHDMKQII